MKCSDCENCYQMWPVPRMPMMRAHGKGRDWLPAGYGQGTLEADVSVGTHVVSEVYGRLTVLVREFPATGRHRR